MTLETLLNGMKSLFAGLGAKTSDSNYGVALLDKTSCEPKGLMGMSDLASVLSDQNSTAFSYIVQGASSIDDCFMGETNDKNLAFTLSTKTLTGMPSAISSSNRFWIIVIQSGSYDIIQIVCARGSNQPYFRCRQGNEANPPITWSQWKEL